jgi:hypothetical protein
MFNSTFSGCSGLTGIIPSGLFAGISGAPAEEMFHYTFSSCTGLTSIPAGLFGTFTGAPAGKMFRHTFSDCTGLTGIADGIWDLSGLTDTNVNGIFDRMFYGCTNITSASPNIAPGSSVKLYQKFTSYSPDNTPFAGCTSMADYASIPAAWK